MSNLKDRLIEGTEAGDHWNHWPDRLEVVGIHVVPHADPYWMYDFGFRMGSSTTMRQVDKKHLPDKVQVWLSSWRNLYQLNDVHFAWASPKGQFDDKEKRNILALFPPRQEYNAKTKTYFLATPALMVEIGCDHEYTVTKPFTSVTHGTCTKCGHQWEVDSSG